VSRAGRAVGQVALGVVAPALGLTLGVVLAAFSLLAVLL
jgi:hypothetical protein